MMAVTVVCDEKSMADKAREWGHSLLPQKEGSNDVGCSSRPPFGSRSVQAFSKSARRGAPPVIRSNVKRQTRVLLPGESGTPATEGVGAREVGQHPRPVAKTRQGRATLGS